MSHRLFVAPNSLHNNQWTKELDTFVGYPLSSTFGDVVLPGVGDFNVRHIAQLERALIEAVVRAAARDGAT